MSTGESRVIKDFIHEISDTVPRERILRDELDRFAWGTDAGFYRLTPQVVIRSSSEGEVSRILRVAQKMGIAVTFRGAGTALSGQSISDSVLLVAGKHWEKLEILEEGRVVRMQPGLLGGWVNQKLRPYLRKLGPDPASIESATIGGIVMNNASGMSCGVHSNSDRMLLSARIILSDGTLLDTADRESREQFRRTHAGFVEALERLRDEVNSDAELVELIRYKYSIKNVTGLNLLPLVTYSDVFDIIAHSVVGSEGTLAFLSEVTMQTVQREPLQASAMIYFRDITDAARGACAMRSLRVAAAEMLDSRSLAAVHDTTGDGLTALLVQVTATEEEELQARIENVQKALGEFQTETGVVFSRDEQTCRRYWDLRAGIFPMVGGMRRAGTTCLIEDVAFHIEDLPEATRDLSELLLRHGYTDSCIYGHALDGNFHFIINQAFSSGDDVARYEAMIEDTVHLVTRKYHGSLKAEHGTGRNMAPFVKEEWGEKAYEVMLRLKRIFDPQGILNPGVIFNADPKCYTRSLKALPELRAGEGAPLETLDAYTRINRCIECGFCERNCVSCGFSLSSRTRIAVLREIVRLRLSGEQRWRLRALERAYFRAGIDTCAADGLCSTSCPMGINVADLTHELRRVSLPAPAGWLWGFAASHYAFVKSGLRGVLTMADISRRVLGVRLMTGLGRLLHKAALPLWTPALPAAYNPQDVVNSQREKSRGKVVYLPSCLNQVMGPARCEKYPRPLVVETVALIEKAGFEVVFPRNMQQLCCGMIWESKGMPALAQAKLSELEQALREASEGGRYPILCDQSPCLHRMVQHIEGLKLYEPAGFVWDILRPRLEFRPLSQSIAVHLTCTTREMGLGERFLDVARLCSKNVVVPEGVGCCAFAGDKGFTHPQLNAYALRKLAPQVKDIEVGYSNSRTCEIGLENNSSIPYVSIIYLVNSCTVRKPSK